ncbi:MAG: aldo/keto reductase [Cellulophaga baltica]
MKEMVLNDGNKLPIVGFGTYKATEQEGIEAVKFALENGYRLLDTAAKYNNEEAVGKGIKLSAVPREEIKVTTKLWRENLSYEEAKSEFETSLQKLELEYIDLYLIHWPANAKNYDNWQHANAEAWRAMEDLQTEGKIKSIGVSNFWPEHLEALFKTARVFPAINQIEFHPGYWQPDVTAYCKAKNITVQSWSPLGRGEILNNNILKSIAKKYQTTVAKVCLRWVTQHDVIVIPKSTTKERIKENIDIFSFELTQEEIQQINAIPKLGYSGEHPNLWPDRES